MEFTSVNLNTQPEVTIDLDTKAIEEGPIVEAFGDKLTEDAKGLYAHVLESEGGVLIYVPGVTVDAIFNMEDN